MMKVKALTSYAFVNEKKQDLTLIYGRIVDENGKEKMGIYDQRWSVVGLNIPFPVRSGTWFEGFATDVMLKYLERNGWTFCGYTSLKGGKTYVVDSIKAAKGVVDNIKREQATEPVKKETEEELNAKIVKLLKDGYRIKAIMTYKEYHPELLVYEIGHRIDEIYSKANAKH